MTLLMIQISKKIFFFFCERMVNFLQIWLLETAYYKNLNVRAVARDAAGEQASSVCVAASCGLGLLPLNKQTNRTVSLGVIVAGRFCAFNHPWKWSFSGD